MLDDDGRVLLFLVLDPTDNKPPVWITPGGGLEPGEQLQSAACRELREETGLEVDPEALGRPVAVTRGDWEFRGTPLYSEDWFFFLQTSAFELDVTRWTDLEREVHRDWRWWTLDELDATAEFVLPCGLSSLVRGLRGGRSSEAPVVLPWLVPEHPSSTSGERAGTRPTSSKAVGRFEGLNRRRD